MVVNDISDCKKLQEDINNFAEWAALNSLFLNVEKCKTISFSRLAAKIEYEYSINNTPTKRESTIKDLGVKFDEKLNFKGHIQEISCSGYRALGFIIRNSVDLSLNCTKILYCSLIWSNLEYACNVWSPFYQCDINCLEGVQKKFLRHFAYRLGINFENYSYSYMKSLLGFESLEKRRFNSDVKYICKIVTGSVNCPELLGKLDFSILRKTRIKDLFNLKFHTTNFGYNNPLTRMQRTYNSVAKEIDPFSQSLNTIKRRLENINLDQT